MPQKEIYTAYHEAGHAVIEWWLFGLRRVKKISIVPNPKENMIGHVKTNRIMKDIDYEVEDSPAFEGKVMRQIMGKFAGYVAEKKIRKRVNHRGAYKDFENVINLASYLYGGFDEKLLKHLQDYLYRRTELLVEQHWSLIEAVAKELLKRKELSRKIFMKFKKNNLERN